MPFLKKTENRVINGHARIKFMVEGKRAVPKDTLRACPFNWHALKSGF